METNKERYSNVLASEMPLPDWFDHTIYGTYNHSGVVIAKDEASEEETWFMVIENVWNDRRIYYEKLYYVTPDVYKKFKYAKEHLPDSKFYSEKDRKYGRLDLGESIQFIVDDYDRILYYRHAPGKEPYTHSNRDQLLNIWKTQDEPFHKINLPVVVSPGTPRQFYVSNFGINVKLDDPRLLEIPITNFPTTGVFSIGHTWKKKDLFKPEAEVNVTLLRWNLRVNICPRSFLAMQAPWNGNEFVHHSDRPHDDNFSWVYEKKDVHYKVVPFNELPLHRRVETYHRVDHTHKKILYFCGFFLDDQRRIFSKDAPYEVINLILPRRDFSQESVVKRGATITFEMDFNEFTRSYVVAGFYPWRDAKHWHTIRSMDVVEPSGRKSVLFSMLLTPTEYAGLYFSYHGTFVWDPYRKMNGINLINHRVAAWCRYTPTSRMGRFEVVKATTRDKPNFPDIKVGIGFILASGKVYSRKYANFEIRLGKYAEFLRKTYEPGDWIRFKAIYHEEFYKITHIYDNRPLMKIKMETAETKIGTAYLLTKMKRHPIMFDVFCSDTIGLVEDPDGTYSTFIKKKFREVFRAAAKLLKNKNVFNPRAPEFPRIPKSEDESIQRQLDEYTRWWKTQPERYNWIDPEKHLNHNLFPYFNYRNGVSYSVTHRHLFDDNWYNVWCIENPDPYGSPLCVCPWEHLPLEKLFSGDDYNIPKVLVEHAINERHKKDDFRRIQIGAPRDQEAERNEAVVSVMNDLETTSLADYYLKKFTDQGNLLDHQ